MVLIGHIATTLFTPCLGTTLAENWQLLYNYYK